MSYSDITKICPISHQEFVVTASDQSFYDKISPVVAAQKFVIPTPRLSPDERRRRRLAFRNERMLYRRKCDASGKSIISLYAPEAKSVITGQPFRVYDQKVRWSDARDPMSYGRDFDFSRSFTENFGELLAEVPRLAIINDNGVGSVNSEYTNDFVNGKNCYMCFEMGDCEDCVYSHHCNGSKDCYDCDEATSSANCYQVSDSFQASHCQYCYGLHTCSFCYHSAYLQGCDHCIFCCGLDNQSYQYMNTSISKEEFTRLHERLQSDQQFFEAQLALYRDSVYRKDEHHLIRGSEQCDGRNIMNSYLLHECYNSFLSEQVSYGLSLYQVKNCMDIQCWKSELCIEGQTLDESYHCGFCTRCSRSKNVWYSDHCHDCDHLFGCVGLRHKSYCIFNKQYTKQDYEITVRRLIEHMMTRGEWGEFFHPSLSPFGYNETVAQEYYTESSTSLLSLGYHRSTYQSPEPQVDRIIPAHQVPKYGEAIPADITACAIKCEVSGKLFRLVPQEIAFYQQNKLPLPRRHPNQRHLERIQAK